MFSAGYMQRIASEPIGGRMAQGAGGPGFHLTGLDHTIGCPGIRGVRDLGLPARRQYARKYAAAWVHVTTFPAVTHRTPSLERRETWSPARETRGTGRKEVGGVFGFVPANALATLEFVSSNAQATYNYPVAFWLWLLLKNSTLTTKRLP